MRRAVLMRVLEEAGRTRAPVRGRLAPRSGPLPSLPFLVSSPPSPRSRARARRFRARAAAAPSLRVTRVPSLGSPRRFGISIRARFAREGRCALADRFRARPRGAPGPGLSRPRVGSRSRKASDAQSSASSVAARRTPASRLSIGVGFGAMAIRAAGRRAGTRGFAVVAWCAPGGGGPGEGRARDGPRGARRRRSEGGRSVVGGGDALSGGERVDGGGLVLARPFGILA